MLSTTIAIISDTHDNEMNLKKVLNFCAQKEIDTIICCGDLTSQETLDFLNDHFLGTIHYTFGNADNDQLRNLEFLQEYKKTKIYSNFGKTEIADKKIAFVHFPEKAKELAMTNQYDFVFYGHTHKPWTEKIGKCVLLNPGTVAGTFSLPTFAAWNIENDHFDLIRINDLS
jgi:putative phosphoesterase